MGVLTGVLGLSSRSMLLEWGVCIGEEESLDERYRVALLLLCIGLKRSLVQATLEIVHLAVPNPMSSMKELACELNEELTMGVSLVPRPRPAFHRLQYGKARSFVQPKAARGPGNEATWECLWDTKWNFF